MDMDFTSEELAFQADVRSFLNTALTGRLIDGARRTPGVFVEPDIGLEWQRILHEKGWLATHWPVEDGGTGWTPVQRYIFEKECALAGAPSLPVLGLKLVGPVICRFGTPEQKARFLPRILSAEDYWCQGFSEPNAGSDLASLTLRARPDGSDYILDGTKIWTSYAHHANRMFALVRTSNEGKRQQGISFLLVDMSLPGITVRPIETIGGDHEVNEVHFAGVRVSQSERVGDENAGWECAKYLLEFERGAGIFSPRLRSQLKRVAKALPQPGTATNDLLRRFGEVASDLDTFEWLELRTMGGLPLGVNPGPVSSILKLRASRLKQAIGELGVEALGAESLRWRSTAPTAQQASTTLVSDYCNSRAHTIFGGAAEIQLGLIARTLLV